MSQSQQKSQNLVMAIAFIGLMFFAIGFAFGINGFLAGPLNTLYGISSMLGYLVLGLSFLPFLLFAKPATATIKKIGYKKTMALSFVFFAVSFALYAIAATIGKNGLTLFYVSAFVGGIGNAFLNATANPYISVIGPIDSAAKRICIMGICNKLAYPVAIIFFGVLMNALGLGKVITEFSQMVTPFYIIMGIFLALGLLTLAMPLPEVKAEGEDEAEDSPVVESSYAAGKTSIMQFPHAIMGALALFIYTGVETMCLNTASRFVGFNAALDGVMILDQSLVIWFASFGMILGYLLGVIMIPKVMSQATALKLCSSVGVLGSIAMILCSLKVLPLTVAPYLLLVVSFGCSMGAPAIWPLSLKDLGKFTKTGSTLLTMGIAGGAVFPPLFGLLADAYNATVGYWLCLPCFLFILYFAVSGYKLRRK